MPKYIPNEEDLYSTKPCFVCGRDVVEPDEETCCDLCEQQWRIFKEDYENNMLNEYYD